MAGRNRPDEPRSPWLVTTLDAEHEAQAGAERDSAAAAGSPGTSSEASAPFVVHAPRPEGAATLSVTHRPGGRHLFTWVGAHGGAGTSSLAASGTGGAVNQLWPDPSLGWPRHVVVVCRSNAAGLSAAARLIQEVVSGVVEDLQLVALVVVADAPGRLPKALRRRVHEISGTVPQLLQIPWVDAWREHPYTPHPSTHTAAEKVTALIKEEA